MNACFPRSAVEAILHVFVPHAQKCSRTRLNYAMRGRPLARRLCQNDSFPQSLFLATNLRGDDLVSRRQSYFRGTIFKGGRILECLVSHKITTPFLPPYTIEVKGQLSRKGQLSHRPLDSDWVLGYGQACTCSSHTRLGTRERGRK